MFYLVIAIILNVVISSLLKLFPKYSINTFQAVVVNYLVCVITGCVFMGQIPVSTETVHASWFTWSLVMGSMFIVIFTLLGLCIKVDGITTATIANKLSLVIPVLFSVILYKETLGPFKVAGILLAIPAIYFTTRVKEANNKPQKLLLPVLIFVGGGLLDTSIKYVQTYHLSTEDIQAQYTIFCFGAAGLSGLLIIVFMLVLKQTKIHSRSIIAGIVVGIPNYFSIYNIIRMLNSNFLQSSAAIPVFNISIIVVSSLTAILIFKEQVNRLRIIGLCLSLLAIILIAFGDR